MALADTRTVVLGTFAFLAFWVLAVFPSFKLMPIGRTAGAMAGAALMVVFQIVSPSEAYESIDLSILGLLFGTMVVSLYLERADMSKYLGIALSWKSRGGKDLMCRVCILSAISSALFTNDTSCVVLTEFVLKLCRQKNLHPKPFLIALATSANIGSVATPIGNPQNLVIAVQSGISFGKFLLGLLPSMLIGVLINTALLLMVYWRRLSPAVESEGKGVVRGLDKKETNKLSVSSFSDVEDDIESLKKGSDDKACSPGFHDDTSRGKASEISMVEQPSLDVKNCAIDCSKDEILSEGATSSIESDLSQGGTLEHSFLEATNQSVDCASYGRFHKESPTYEEHDLSRPSDLLQIIILESKEEDAEKPASSLSISPVLEVSQGYTKTPSRSVSCSSLFEEEKASALKKWKRRCWKCAVYSVTAGMLAALLYGLDLSWSALTAAVLLMALDFQDAGPSFEKVSYPLLVFFAGMFITVHGFNTTGIPGTFWESVEPHARINSLSGIAVLSLVVIVLSNVASNVPTVLLLGSRVSSSAALNGASVTRSWLILAWTSTVAGNLTLVGSAANLIVSEQAAKAQLLGYELTFWNHLMFGLPSTLLVAAIGLPSIRG